MKTIKLPGKLVYKIENSENMVPGPLQARSVIFDQGKAIIKSPRGIFWRTMTVIPFEIIRQVRHRIAAPVSFHMESSSLEPYRGFTTLTEIYLDLRSGANELLYRFGCGRGAGRVYPAPSDITRTQELADQIASVMRKPVRIDIEEVEFSIDKGSRTIEMTGSLLPVSIRGTVIPFERVLTILAVKEPDGYISSSIVTRDGDSILTMQKKDVGSHLSETLALCAQAAGLPFEVREDMDALPLMHS